MSNSNKWGGLTCAGCGSNDMELRVMWSGADWNCKAGARSGYGWEVCLCCQCGRVYHICNCKNEEDVSPAK